jgi:hypothetical protein
MRRFSGLPSLYPLRISASSSPPQDTKVLKMSLFYSRGLWSAINGPALPTYASVNMLSLLFHLNFWSSVYSSTVTGIACPVTNATGTTYTGECVPLDINSHNFACNGIFAFLVFDVCLEQEGQNFQNVFPFQILLSWKRMPVAFKSNVPTTPIQAATATANRLMDIVAMGREVGMTTQIAASYQVISPADFQN